MRVIRRPAAALRDLPLSLKLLVPLLIILTAAIVSGRLGDARKRSSSLLRQGESARQGDSTLKEASSQETFGSVVGPEKDGKSAAPRLSATPSSGANGGSSPARNPVAVGGPADRPDTSPTPGPKPGPGCATAEGGAPGVGFGGGTTCSYKATKRGGYEGLGSWTITIKRGETTIEVNSDNDPDCSETGFIQPGDEVTARVPACCGYNSISVGDDAHCGRFP